MAWRLLTRNDVVDLMSRGSYITGGTTEDKIVHSLAIADIALSIADTMIEDGIDVDRQAAEMGGLLHDVGQLKVGICEPVRYSPEHCGWGGWLCRKWGFPESVAQAPEGHELWTPEVAKQLYFPEPIQETYFPTTIEGKIGAFSDWCGSIATGRLDPWKDSDAYLDCQDSAWRKGTWYWKMCLEMVEANIGITEAIMEDRFKRAFKLHKALRKLFFPYLKKEFLVNKNLADRVRHTSMGPWFPLPEKSRQPPRIDLLKTGQVYIGNVYIGGL